jgi:Spy/CpxP family protein refolding chaperone
MMRIHLVSGLIVLGTFLAGGLAGVGLAHSLGPRLFLHHPGAPPFVRELDLSPEQDAKVREVLERHRHELDAVERAMKSEMRAVLTPEQQKKFDEMEARRPRGPPRRLGLPPPPPR